MSLSAAQTRILRDMANGAVLKEERGANRIWLYTPGILWGDAVNRRLFTDLKDRKLIESTVKHGPYIVFALTPAGAAAAGEGA